MPPVVETGTGGIRLPFTWEKMEKMGSVLNDGRGSRLSAAMAGSGASGLKRGE